MSNDNLNRISKNLFITNLEYRKYKKKIESFSVFDGNTGDYISIEYSKDIEDVFSHYYSVWRYCNKFGLPYVGADGWPTVQTWILDLMILFDDIMSEPRYE